MATKLTMKGRNPRPKATQAEKPVESLSEALEALLIAEEEAQPDIPAVRLKSTDTTYNAKQERVILMRRNPFAQKSEYAPAITRVSYAALRQWCDAGIGALFPSEHREAAELDILTEVHQVTRAKHKDARNAYFKHSDAVAKLEEEIEPAYPEDHPERLKAIWNVKVAARDRDLLSAQEGTDRYQMLQQGLCGDIILTSTGRAMTVQGMLLAMCDCLPSRELLSLPEGARSSLREAVSDKSFVEQELLEELRTLPPGDWINEGIREGIRQCAGNLLSIKR